MMNDRRRSPIWKMPKEKFAILVKNSSSISEILKASELISKGGNYRTVKGRIKEENLDISHIPLGLNSNKGKKFFKEKTPLEDLLVKGSTYSRTHLKKRLIEEEILENKCAICGQLPQWNGKLLVLVLDHINGISNDNRRKNLRLLCPNCNSQTDTFAGKKPRKRCVDCGRFIQKTSTRCRICSNKINALLRRKVKNRPPLKILKEESIEFGFVGTGRKYGVSDNTIRKWMKAEVG